MLRVAVRDSFAQTTGWGYGSAMTGVITVATLAMLAVVIVLIVIAERRAGVPCAECGAKTTPLERLAEDSQREILDYYEGHEQRRPRTQATVLRGGECHVRSSGLQQDDRRPPVRATGGAPGLVSPKGAGLPRAN